MSATMEQKALGLVRAFERAGKLVKSVTIEGRKVELVLAEDRQTDEFEGIDMRHDKA